MAVKSSYEGLVNPMAYSALMLNLLIVGVSIYLIIYFVALTVNAALDVSDALIPSSEIVKTVEPTRWYALLVATVSSLFRISPQEVICEYTRDLAARSWIVRHSFPSNSLTKKFLNKYSSRFLTKGYDIGFPKGNVGAT
ncbi:hypothetical protein KIN20_007088 [Parelaphostrongylus tenuis]|uniref:Uncharacterized protein n=1 Tax=Parelaphostrongylus tenuis TaxID=148309 RepID=A0AAD5M2T9_PARTN|nr:hypothetical protein KIN20_007088 [Parelaphostrongylus tenuis]